MCFYYPTLSIDSETVSSLEWKQGSIKYLLAGGLAVVERPRESTDKTHAKNVKI
jgi:hypothetical protein